MRLETPGEVRREERQEWRDRLKLAMENLRRRMMEELPERTPYIPSEPYFPRRIIEKVADRWGLKK